MRRHRPTARPPRRPRDASRTTKRCDKIQPFVQTRQTRSPRSTLDAFVNPNLDFESLTRAHFPQGSRVREWNEVFAKNKRLDAPRRGTQRPDLTLRQLYRSIIRLSAHAEQTLNHAIDVQRRRHGGDVEAVALSACARSIRIERGKCGWTSSSERTCDRSIDRPFRFGVIPTVRRPSFDRVGVRVGVCRRPSRVASRRVLPLSNPSTCVSGVTLITLNVSLYT